MACLAAAAMALSPLPAGAQQRTIIRDTEIEQLMRDYVAPILKAAGIRSGSVKVVLIGDRSFNAFVADGRRIFINTGALIDSKTPNEVIGVLAHESGHIAGGHLARLREQIANAQILSVVGMLFGAAALAGSAAAGSRVGNAGYGGAGVLAGSQELVKRNLLAYARGEEQAADQAALRYLNATGQSPKGMLDTFRRFADEAIFRTASIDPYLQSHPMPQERIANLEALAKQSPNYSRKDPPTLQARHDLMRAKLVGFTERPETVLRRYPPSDGSLAARYARAISTYRSGRLMDAVAQIDGLIKEQPGNPYFWELKGQALLEGGRAREAVEPLRKAVSMAPSSALIRGMLGHALVATDNPAVMDEAIRELQNATQREPDSAENFRHLATAYARKGNIAMAELASAQYYFAQGEWSAAATQASRAQAKLPKGSPGWLKADDILTYQPPKPQR
ncbi:M48 family metalloprotease [Chelatococcus sp. SYSU_G07232]|uniref:M48 family metalloprotease n=1 Tax=Chelatococcus albus TaxID=3047466 RepID=A0ABT7ABF4_9HYPH|nr:M48 family metalloprotease [Chelatococcus sp. SYSU_G07232]MDJ1156705.1 M48 family metalloprotease [Chelatococcus sp. SYSU_G07232]